MRRGLCRVRNGVLLAAILLVFGPYLLLYDLFWDEQEPPTKDEWRMM